MASKDWLCTACLLCACTATDLRQGSHTDAGTATPPGDSRPASHALSRSSAVPRLSRREIEATIQDAFGISGLALGALPPDADVAVNPITDGEEPIFDTFTGTLGDYVPSEVFVQGLSTLAFDVAKQVSANRARVDALAGCKPAEARDAACMRALIERLGLRLYRRPLTADERSRLETLALAFANDGDFYTGVRAVIQSLVQSPDFVYRPEIGSKVANGLRRLNNFELVSRLSYLFWGTAPSWELLERAGGSELSARELREIVQSIATDARTDEQIRSMHAMWLRYEQALVVDPALRQELLTETDALLDRVITDVGRPWSELFTSTQTYAGPVLASHYGMSQKPSTATWVTYEDPERAGILSHGSFLSLSATKGNETLPSRRGAIILRQILCRTISPPPPDVDIDDGVEVPAGSCKSDAYEAHSQAGSSCQACHSLIDPIGFGFERFDGLGAYRTVERDNPSCGVDGLGNFDGKPFSGPREFVDLVMQSGDLTQCGTEQLLRFALRRPLSSEDEALLQRLHGSFLDSGEDFRTLLIELALDPSFRYRREA